MTLTKQQASEKREGVSLFIVTVISPTTDEEYEKITHVILKFLHCNVRRNTSSVSQLYTLEQQDIHKMVARVWFIL